MPKHILKFDLSSAITYPSEGLLKELGRIPNCSITKTNDGYKIKQNKTDLLEGKYAATAQISFQGNTVLINTSCGGIGPIQKKHIEQFAEVIQCIILRYVENPGAVQELSDKITCLKCGSTQIELQQRGWTLSTGFIGASRTKIVCLNCLHKFEADAQAQQSIVPPTTPAEGATAAPKNFTPSPQAQAVAKKVRNIEVGTGIAWIILGIIQLCLIYTAIAGIWNIVNAIISLRSASNIQAGNEAVVPYFEKRKNTLITFTVINILLGAVLGVFLVAFDWYNRDYVLKNRSAFSSDAEIPTADISPANVQEPAVAVGAASSTNFCANCGSKAIGPKHFCTNCGAKL